MLIAANSTAVIKYIIKKENMHVLDLPEVGTIRVMIFEKDNRKINLETY